uniref:Protein kinase C and casein kinase substrate in neurons 2 n=1 Tax=Pavo cristatus TaxID=9049 RepID=A0A8C9G4S8_PAVCR
ELLSRTVKRIDDGHRLCNDLMNCIHERARIEKVYAQQLTEWAKRWKQLVEKGPQYGTVERAWCAFMSEAEKVSELHLEVKGSLMNEDFEKIKNWQKEAFHKQMMGGFKETKEAEDGFRKAQKPWAKKLKEEWSADLNRTLSRREKKKASDGVTLTGINQTGDQVSQPNKHSSSLSVQSNTVQSVQSSYNPFEDEEDTGSTVSEKEDNKIKNVSSYEKNQSYPTDWSDEESNNPFSSTDANGDTNPFDEDTSPAMEVRVRALYDYEGQEQDELSFKAGKLTKTELQFNEDEQGWCKGRLDNGQVGLYPANYVEPIQ